MLDPNPCQFDGVVLICVSAFVQKYERTQVPTLSLPWARPCLINHNMVSVNINKISIYYFVLLVSVELCETSGCITDVPRRVFWQVES